jgi:hypothetical protein
VVQTHDLLGGKRKKLNKKPLYHKCGKFVQYANCSSCIPFKNVFHHIHHPTFFTNFSHLQHSFFSSQHHCEALDHPKETMKTLVSISHFQNKGEKQGYLKKMFLLFRKQSSTYQNFFSFFSFHAPFKYGFICETTKNYFYFMDIDFESSILYI